MLLENKKAIIYGAGGGIGGGVARVFAREGATVFLAGRTRQKLEAVARDITAAGGSADVAVLDVNDEQAVTDHANAVAAKAGSIDISFNLTSRGDVQGIPLVDIPAEDMTRAVTNGLKASFITARAAARHMIKQKSGVILSLTSATAHGAPPMMGSTGPADAAVEVFMRSLARELAPQGVRVVGMWTAAVPETLSREKIAAVNSSMQMDEAGFKAMLAGMAQMFPLGRAPSLSQVAETAAHLASDHAGAITGTIVDLTCGLGI